MAWVRLVLCLLCSRCLLGLAMCGVSLSFAPSNHDTALDQPRIIRVSRGGSVTLSCSCDPCNFTDFHSKWEFCGANGDPATLKIIAMRTSSKSRARDQEAKFSVTHQMNSQSLLVIKNLWLNDTGTYICTMTTKVPPPTRTFRGYGTRLEVYAFPKVWLSSSAEAALHTALVTCTVSRFYPPTLHITLNTTCGGYKVLDDNASVIMTNDGTFNMTYKAWVNAADCHNGTEVTCSVKQLKEMHRTLWIPGKRNEGSEVLFYTRLVIAMVVILWLILLVLFRKYAFNSGNQRVCFGK